MINNSSETSSDRTESSSMNSPQQEIDMLRCQLYDLSNENYQLQIACRTKDEDIQKIMVFLYLVTFRR